MATPSTPTSERSFSQEERAALLAHARLCAVRHLEGKPPPSGVAGFSPHRPFDAPGACFVTFHTADGRLRGCIGNLEAFEPLAANVGHNAVAAAFRDPRFRPVGSKAELDSLRIEISVLTPPEPISSPEEFIVGEHGIIIRKSGRSAVFLPQVAPEQGWSREETLWHLCSKAGLPATAWSEPDARFFVFRAIVFGEPPRPPPA